MMTVDEFAPAKINLTLHVTGQRDDGYHLLDSLVVFADVGDRISATESPAFSFQVTGPAATGVPLDEQNLVVRAARLFDAGSVAISLTKNLPVASGIGGGSSDCAATLRALSRFWGKDLPHPDDILSLGADVPVCLRRQTTRMSGIGDDLVPVNEFPALDAVLVNPGVEVPTPAVFAELNRKKNVPMPDVLPRLRSQQEAAAWIASQRNDLESPARELAPEISTTLNALRSFSTCLLARMSGSGATCFALFPDATAARQAANALSQDFPDWWIVPTRLG